MSTLAFEGSATALSSDGMALCAEALHVSNPEIWAVLSVETSGCGYLADRRPQILFERHIFHRLTKGKFDDSDVSDPTTGGYGPGERRNTTASIEQFSKTAQPHCKVPPGVLGRSWA
jgi:hypothetical protein